MDTAPWRLNTEMILPKATSLQFVCVAGGSGERQQSAMNGLKQIDSRQAN